MTMDTTNKIREALKYAYKEAQESGKHFSSCEVDRLNAMQYVKIVKDALTELDKAQQTAEPVAWKWRQLMHGYMGGWHFKCETYNPLNNVHVKPEDIEDLTPLYTHPPQAQQPSKVLTDEDALGIAIEYGCEMGHIKEFMEWATPRINARIIGPVVTHMNIDPNASQETKAAVAEVVRAAYTYKPDKVLTDEEIMSKARSFGEARNLAGSDMALESISAWEMGARHARDNGYLAPAAGLTVEDLLECVKELEDVAKACEQFVRVLGLDSPPAKELAERARAILNKKPA